MYDAAAAARAAAGGGGGSDPGGGSDLYDVTGTRPWSRGRRPSVDACVAPMSRPRGSVRGVALAATVPCAVVARGRARVRASPAEDPASAERAVVYS